MSGVYEACRISIYDDQFFYKDNRTCYTLSEAEIEIQLMRREDFQDGVITFFDYAIIPNSLFQFILNMRNIYDKLTARNDYLLRNDLQELSSELVQLETDFWKRRVKQQE